MIEVLKQMVDALEWCYGGEPINTAEAIQAGKKAIAELESQEPVAHRDGYWCTDLTCKKCYSADFRLKHTTHPPQRTWQGLTDEEVESYWDWEDFQTGAGCLTILKMVRDIEAKLKEKNT